MVVRIGTISALARTSLHLRRDVGGTVLGRRVAEHALPYRARHHLHVLLIHYGKARGGKWQVQSYATVRRSGIGEEHGSAVVLLSSCLVQ
jgi:hypothetical protein